MEHFDTILEYTETLSSLYDAEKVEIDYFNGNFDLDYPDLEIDQYYMPRIVAESLINGQFKQAKQQYSAYGLSPSHMDEYLTKDQLINLLD